jgi:hypothetical protein
MATVPMVGCSKQTGKAKAGTGGVHVRFCCVRNCDSIAGHTWWINTSWRSMMSGTREQALERISHGSCPLTNPRRAERSTKEGDEGKLKTGGLEPRATALTGDLSATIPSTNLERLAYFGWIWDHTDSNQGNGGEKGRRGLFRHCDLGRWAATRQVWMRRGRRSEAVCTLSGVGICARKEWHGW